MKKVFVLIISLILILTIISSVFSLSATAVSIRDNRIPLAGGDLDFGADEPEETQRVSPRTGDDILFIILAGISLTAATAGIVKKSRVK